MNTLYKTIRLANMEIFFLKLVYLFFLNIFVESTKYKNKTNHENNINCYWNYATCNENIIDKYPKHKLGYQFFEPNINYLVKSDTGTGKTTSFKHYVKDSKKKFISIVSRVSLADEQYRVFSEHNITCKHYNIADHLHNGDNIIITIDSIGRMYDIDFSDYVIFLDEYNSL